MKSLPLALSLALSCALRAASPEVAVGALAEYAVYREVEALYQAGMASEDCKEVAAISAMLKELRTSKEVIPPELSAELGAGRAEVGIYVRHIRRVLNKRKSELCPVVPAPNRVVEEPTEPDAIDRIYGIARDSQYCSIVLSAAQQMIAESDESVAPHTLELLLRIMRQRPECFH